MASVGVVFQRQTNLFVAAYMANRINIKQYKLYNYIDLEAPQDGLPKVELDF